MDNIGHTRTWIPDISLYSRLLVYEYSKIMAHISKRK